MVFGPVSQQEVSGHVTSLRWQVGRLSRVEAALREWEDWVVCDGFELQSKSERTVCLALFWHSALFRAHKTMITMK